MTETQRQRSGRPDGSEPPRMARIFGLSGLAPFFALSLAALALDAEGAARALSGLEIYGAVILSFIGGCRWGFSSAGFGAGPTVAAMAIAVAPSLWAAAALWLAPASAIAPVLALGLALMFVEDWRATRSGDAPPWWLRLRLPLSVGAILALLAPSLG